MDPKKLEGRLYEWSRQLGFTLPDGSFPQSSLFSLLISTPNTLHLWHKILEKVEPRDRIKKIRQQILVAKLRSDEKLEGQQDPVLNVNGAGIHRKIELWKKKKALEKIIAEKRKDIDELLDDIYKKAQSVQSESCKLAEIEKYHSDLKEKLLLSNLLIENHKNNIDSCKEQILKIKSFGSINYAEGFEKHSILEKVDIIQKTMIENLEKKDFKLEEKDFNEVNELIRNQNLLPKLWDLFLHIKTDNLQKYATVVEDNEDSKKNLEENVLKKSLMEKFMLDITENSLQTLLNRKLEKIENFKLKQLISNIEKLMFNKSISSASQADISYISPNETGDSLTGSREKISKLMKALSLQGLRKRNEFLKREIEKLSEENKKNEHWTAEKEKLEGEALCSSEALNKAMREATGLVAVQKSSSQGVLKNVWEFVHLMDEVNKDLEERRVFEVVKESVADIKKGNEYEIALVSDICLDVFRRIQISPGKDIYEYESPQHCLDHYGGELREFFSTMLLSPYDKPEEIISKLEERKKFLSYVRDVIERAEMNVKNSETFFAEGTGDGVNLEAVCKNYKEAIRILLKVITRLENLEKDLDLARNVLKSWFEQPFRLMIPDSIAVNSMTLRQFEEKYRMAETEIKYCTEVNQRLGHK